MITFFDLSSHRYQLQTSRSRSVEITELLHGRSVVTPNGRRLIDWPLPAPGCATPDQQSEEMKENTFTVMLWLLVMNLFVSLLYFFFICMQDYTTTRKKNLTGRGTFNLIIAASRQIMFFPVKYFTVFSQHYRLASHCISSSLTPSCCR